MPLHGQNRGVFKDGELVRDGLEKFQGMELGLVLEFHRPCRGKGEGEAGGKAGGQAQGGRRLGLGPELLRVAAIEIGAALLPAAGDALLPYQAPVCPDGGLVGLGIVPGPLPAECGNQVLIDQTVLGGDFSRGVPGLAAADPVGLQHDCPAAGLLQGGCN